MLVAKLRKIFWYCAGTRHFLWKNEIYLNLATSFLSKNKKNSISIHLIFMGFYVTRSKCVVMILKKYLNRRFLLLLLTSKTNLEAVNEDSPKDNVNLGQ